MKANQEVMETYPEKMEANSEEMKSVVDHGDQNLGAGHCQKLKDRTQDNAGSWKMLAAPCIGMTCHALPAWHKGHCC